LGADRYEIVLVPYEEKDRANDPELRVGWMDAKGRAAELLDLPSLRRLYERAQPRFFPVFDLSDDEWSSLMAQFEGAFRT
jgi:hypothetical protein